jgi:hypothetical protein
MGFTNPGAVLTSLTLATGSQVGITGGQLLNPSGNAVQPTTEALTSGDLGTGADGAVTIGTGVTTLIAGNDQLVNPGTVGDWSVVFSSGNLVSGPTIVVGTIPGQAAQGAVASVVGAAPGQTGLTVELTQIPCAIPANTTAVITFTPTAISNCYGQDSGAGSVTIYDASHNPLATGTVDAVPQGTQLSITVATSATAAAYLSFAYEVRGPFVLSGGANSTTSLGVNNFQVTYGGGQTVTLTRDMNYSSLTVLTGSILNTAGYRIRCTGLLTNNGTIRNNGSNGSAAGAAGAPYGSYGGSASCTYGSSTFQTPGIGYDCYGGGVPPSAGVAATPAVTSTGTLPGTLDAMRSYQMAGGVSGGAVAASGTPCGGSGAGVVWIACQATAGGGIVEANGGNGYCSAGGGAGASVGFGGSGGIVEIVTQVRTDTWTIEALGGTSSANTPTISPSGRTNILVTNG